MLPFDHFSSLPEVVAQMRPLLWMLPLVLAFAALKRLAPKLRGITGEAQVGRALERIFQQRMKVCRQAATP